MTVFSVNFCSVYQNLSQTSLRFASRYLKRREKFTLDCSLGSKQSQCIWGNLLWDCTLGPGRVEAEDFEGSGSCESNRL